MAGESDAGARDVDSVCTCQDFTGLTAKVTIVAITPTTAKAASEFAEKTTHARLRGRGTVGRRGIVLMNAQKDGQLMGQRCREDVA